MELRHLRYFVAVAEERSFVHGARRLRVAQPALSKQVRDLEAELGVTLFDRLPRGVRLTRGGEAFLAEAQRTLEAAGHAITRARAAADRNGSNIGFAHGEPPVYTPVVEDLLARFRRTHQDVAVRVVSMNDADAPAALRERQVDVAAVFMSQWPVAGFHALRLVDCAIRGVLLPAGHPIAAQPTVRLPELRALPWLHAGPQRWPGCFRTIEQSLRERGLIPLQQIERRNATPWGNVPIAAGDAWSLAPEAFGAPYRTDSTAIVYRPFVEPPIPVWLALVWCPKALPVVHELVSVARQTGPLPAPSRPQRPARAGRAA